jgi:hypothetical protein
MKHLIPVLFEVEAPDYADAEQSVFHWVANHREGATLDVWPEGTLTVNVEDTFERDNDGQRVIYLPPENIDEEAGDIEVSFEEEPEEDDTSYHGFPD